MKAMILAAGRGQRMQPLTNTVPKPLLNVRGKPLLQYHVENLASAGVKQIVINHARFGDQIEAYFGHGEEYGVEIYYSPEGDTPLGTGGGIKRSLPLLGRDPFIVVSADIWTDFNYGDLPDSLNGYAHLILVDNPAHHPQGDFCLHGGLVALTGGERLTYGNLGVYSHELFLDCEATNFPLGPLLFSAAEKHKISGEYYSGEWVNVGTPEQLSALNQGY